jgi:SAM-dependent methyltransferase
MSFAYYNVSLGINPSQEFWYRDAESVEEQTELCRYETTLDVIVNALPREGPIVETGCGLARWVIHLRRAGFPVAGLDLSHAALARARQAAGDVPLMVGDALRLPFPDDSLTAVLSFGVIEHFPEGPQAALRELWRVLRPGGVAFISVPYNSYLRRTLLNHLRRVRDWQKRRARLALQFAEYRFSAAELRGFLEETGFAVTSMHPDEFRLPLGKGLWVDSSTLFGYRTNAWEIAPGHRHWEMSRWGRLLRQVLDPVSPWCTAGGVLAVARPRK